MIGGVDLSLTALFGELNDTLQKGFNNYEKCIPLYWKENVADEESYGVNEPREVLHLVQFISMKDIESQMYLDHVMQKSYIPYQAWLKHDKHLYFSYYGQEFPFEPNWDTDKTTIVSDDVRQDSQD